MTREELLKEHILKKYKNLREFSQLAKIPYSTITNIINRGVGNSSANTIISICNVLDIDFQSLYDGYIAEKGNCTDSDKSGLKNVDKNLYEFENKLKDFILTRYKSLREFAILTQIPYSTIDSIFKRGIDRTGIINIIKICRELGISVDMLAQGEIVLYTPHHYEDKNLIDAYHELNESGRLKVTEYIADLKSMPKYIETKTFKIAGRDGTNTISLTPQQIQELTKLVNELDDDDDNSDLF